MKTIYVDGEMSERSVFLHNVGDICEIEVVGTFFDGWEALAFAQRNPVDLAVLGIQLNGMDGIFLAKRLKILYPDILFIFITKHERYAMEAIRLHAAAYLIKPYTKEELQYAIQSAQLLSRRTKKRIFVKTFGHFDVFVDEKPIMFRSAKAKELLALLVDRQGGTVNTDQIICALWEERPNDEATQNLCSKVTKNLQKELKEYGAQEMLITSRGIRRVDREAFSCDLYELLSGNEHARRRFVGDYMLDYSWAEERMGQLNRIIYGREIKY